MSQLEACAMLEIEASTAKALTDLGFLKRTPGKDRTTRSTLDPTSVSEFARRYAAGKLYAPALGCHPTQVARKMAARGVHDIVSATGSTEYNRWKLSPFFERSVMRELLQLTKEPDEEDDVKHFWKEVAYSLGRHKSLFMLRQIYPDGSAMFSDPSREWPIYLEHIFEKPTYPTHPSIKTEYPENYVYSLRATFRMAGKDRWRAAELADFTFSRELPAPICFRYDEFNGVFEAILYTHFRGKWQSEGGKKRLTFSNGAEFGKIVMEILELMRGVLYDGSQKYDPRTFGRWEQWRDA